MKKVIIKLLVALLLPFIAVSQIPPGYYNTAGGKTGSQLKATLHNIIKGHTTYSYSSLWNILSNTDRDPGNSNNVILIYSGKSRAKSQHGGSQGDWNREHVWAKSHGNFGTTPPCGTDVHHIRPADVQVNGLRGHLDFDNGGNPVPGAPGCYKDNDSFEPRNAVKGDVARMIFYMAVRYEGDNGEPDLEIVDRVNTYPNPELGKLSTLLQWNILDPPDSFERNRNNVIYYQYQHNRNPFIDHPEYITAIWGGPSDVKNNPELNLQVYPNPVNTTLHFECGSNYIYYYSLFTLSGKTLGSSKLKNGENTVDVSFLPRGLYILMVKNQSGQFVHRYKIIKSNR